MFVWVCAYKQLFPGSNSSYKFSWSIFISFTFKRNQVVFCTDIITLTSNMWVRNLIDWIFTMVLLIIVGALLIQRIEKQYDCTGFSTNRGIFNRTKKYIKKWIHAFNCENSELICFNSFQFIPKCFWMFCVESVIYDSKNWFRQHKN